MHTEAHTHIGTLGMELNSSHYNEKLSVITCNECYITIPKIGWYIQMDRSMEITTDLWNSFVLIIS